MIEPEERVANKIYDPLASTYGTSETKYYITFLEYDLIRCHTKSTDVCLDVGIANGLFAIPLSRRVREVYGVDISPKMIDECKRRLEEENVINVKVYERSAKDMLFPDSTFDVVYSYATLILVPEPERAYREIARVLKPGGYAILDITGKYNLSRVFWTRYYRKKGLWGINYYPLSEIRFVFQSLGFEIQEIHALGLTDQWKYIPGLHFFTFLDRVFHSTASEPDLDYRLSQKLISLSNRWFFVLRKAA